MTAAPSSRFAANSLAVEARSARFWKRSPSNWREFESRSDLDGDGLLRREVRLDGAGVELPVARDAQDGGENEDDRGRDEQLAPDPEAGDER